MLPPKALISPCAALMLSACASVPAPDYPIDHPANPGAAAARMDDTPDAIARYQRGFSVPAPAAQTDPRAGHANQGEPAPEEEDAHAHHR
jgi:hypothetical protein